MASDDSSASSRPELTEMAEADARPSPQPGNGNGGGLPFRITGQTEPVKVKPRASDPFRIEAPPAVASPPPADPLAALPAEESQSAAEAMVDFEPEAAVEPPPPADPFRPDEPLEVTPAAIASRQPPQQFEVEQDAYPNRGYDTPVTEEEYIAARTHRLRGGGRYNEDGYDPYAYEDRRAWYADARVWGSLLAAMAIGVILAVVFVLLGNTDDGEPEVASDGEVEPGVVIQAPAEGDTVAVGQPYNVLAEIAHPDGVGRVELQVDGQIVGTFEPQAVAGGEPPDEANATIAWTPEDPRDYQLAVFAFTSDGAQIGQETRLVTANFADGSEAFVQASDPVNVREYPSTDDVVQTYGKLQPNEERKILQRTTTDTGEWYLIEFAPASPTGQGWVFAQVVNVIGDLGTVQVVEPPILPTPTPSPTETPTVTPSETATEVPETDFDLEPVGYDDGFVEIKNNGPGDFSGSIVIFYLTATLEDGCQLDTASGQYTVEGVALEAGEVLSVGINDELEPNGLYCVGIAVDGEIDNTNNAVGPFQGDAPTPTATP